MNRRIYTVEKPRKSERYRLAVYSENAHLLDKLDLDGQAGAPRADRLSASVYIPCLSRGVLAVWYENNKLNKRYLLQHQNMMIDSLSVVSQDTLCVCALDGVYVIDAAEGTVTEVLEPPKGMEGWKPFNIAVLGESILVQYDKATLLVYRLGVEAPGKLVKPLPKGSFSVSRLITDDHSRFLLVDPDSARILVLDVSGQLASLIRLPKDTRPQDCTIIGNKLWVGCRNGTIIVMS